MNAKYEQQTVIKKYANRRLYNTATSCYVTLEELSKMIRQGEEFTVHDAKTGEDLTRAVLTQIIVEEEAKGHNMLPISFLRQLISLYGDNLQSIVPRYLEMSMQAFAENQNQLRQYLQGTLQTFFPFGAMGDFNKQNRAMFEKTFGMFSPFPKDASETPAPEDAQTVNALQEQIDSLKQQIDAIQKGKDKPAQKP